MNRARLTESLAVQVMGWKVAPGRYIKPNRSWTPTWRFAPLNNLDQAFELLDKAGGKFILSAGNDGAFHVEVRVGHAVGKASGTGKARALVVALALALGMEVKEDGL